MTAFSAGARRQGPRCVSRFGRRITRLAGACAALVLVSAGVVRAQETSLTIYQSGRVLVRRTFPVAVPRGSSTLEVGLGAPNVDPGTLVALDSGVEVRGVTVTAGTGLEAALRRAVGGPIEFMVERGDSLRFVRGTLLSLDPQAVRVEGRVLYTFPGTPALPDSVVSLQPQVSVTVEASRPRSALRLAYQVDGLQWRAAYALVVPHGLRGPATGAMTGLATIDNPGGLAFTGAQVQLLAGEVRRAAAAPGPRPMMARAAVEGNALEEAAAGVPSEEAVGETHLYTLPGAVDVEPGQSRSVALFPEAAAEVAPEYVLRHASYVYQAMQGQPETDLHPEVGYLVRRPKGTPFGDTPLPAGIVRVLAPDSAGRLQLLGETEIQHTPAGRELHLVTGTAFDLTAQRTQTAFALEGPRVSVSSYRVTIQSAKSDTVTVQVVDQFPGQFEVLSSTVPAERVSASTVRFQVRVPAGGETTLEYRVRARW